MTDICECCGQLMSSMSLRGKSRNLTIEQQAAEIERLREALQAILDVRFDYDGGKVAAIAREALYERH